MRFGITLAAAAALVAVPAIASAQSTVFNDEASFLANVEPGFLDEDFSGLVFGSSTSETFTNGDFTAVATGVDLGGDGSADLFNDVGVLSLNSATDALNLDLSGTSTVTAVGGNIFASDINFDPIAATIVFTLSDGTVETVSTSSTSDFTGFVSSVPITSILIDAPDIDDGAGGITFNWPAATSLVVGTAVPEPTSLGLLGLGGLALVRRRR